jgi:membrane associated rhomboid family serine protease
MLPIGDERVQGGPPAFVTYGLIALNVVAFLVELAQPSEAALQSFIQAWGVVPREYSSAQDLPPGIPLPFWSTLLTSCSCTADGCISAETCCTSGFLATTWRS